MKKYVEIGYIVYLLILILIINNFLNYIYVNYKSKTFVRISVDFLILYSVLYICKQKIGGYYGKN